MDADRIFVTSSMQEAMFLLEHCTNLAIGNVKISHFLFSSVALYILCSSKSCFQLYLCLCDPFS